MLTEEARCYKSERFIVGGHKCCFLILVSSTGLQKLFRWWENGVAKSPHFGIYFWTLPVTWYVNTLDFCEWLVVAALCWTGEPSNQANRKWLDGCFHSIEGVMKLLLPASAWGKRGGGGSCACKCFFSTDLPVTKIYCRETAWPLLNVSSIKLGSIFTGWGDPTHNETPNKTHLHDPEP